MRGFWLADLAGVADLGLPERPRAPAWREVDREPPGGEAKRAERLGVDADWLAWANGPAPVGVSLDHAKPPMLDVSGLRPFYFGTWPPLVLVGRRVRFWPKECAIDMRRGCPCRVCMTLPRRLGHDPILRGARGRIVEWPDRSWRNLYAPMGHPYCVQLTPPVVASWPEGAIGAWTFAAAAVAELELLDEHGNTIWPDGRNLARMG